VEYNVPYCLRRNHCLQEVVVSLIEAVSRSGERSKSRANGNVQEASTGIYHGGAGSGSEDTDAKAVEELLTGSGRAEM
jgi:hypothetical protein